MTQYNIPINKGNYSMDTHERDVEFEKINQLDGKRVIKNIEKNGMIIQNQKLSLTIFCLLILSRFNMQLKMSNVLYYI